MYNVWKIDRCMKMWCLNLYLTENFRHLELELNLILILPHWNVPGSNFGRFDSILQ
jgi:hypothetical protein